MSHIHDQNDVKVTKFYEFTDIQFILITITFVKINSYEKLITMRYIYQKIRTPIVLRLFFYDFLLISISINFRLH